MGLKKFFQRREKSIKGCFYSLRGSAVRFCLRQNNGWEWPLVQHSLLVMFTLQHWGLGLICITWNCSHLACDVLLEKQCFMFMSCHIYENQLRNSSWNSICTYMTQLPVNRALGWDRLQSWDPLLGPTVFFRLCKSLSTCQFLHLVLPSEKA